MVENNLTKEEMKSYINISNLLEENKKDIDKILSINRNTFNKDNLYSFVPSKTKILLYSLGISLLIFLVISSICLLLLKSKVLFLSSVVGEIICLVIYISLFVNYSYVEKTLIKLSNLLEKISTKGGDSLTNIVNLLPFGHKERYFKLKRLFEYLNLIGYYDNYLTSKEKNKIDKIKKEKETIYQKIKNSKEPIEKEFWEMKLKEVE